jgi:hypothetical protein
MEKFSEPLSPREDTIIRSLQWVIDGKESAMCEANSNAVLGEGWRDARKELPPDGERHIVLTQYDEYTIAQLQTDGAGRRHWQGIGYTYKVKAWHILQLPDPPAFA